ncbi:MAG: outer membrane lipoprotein-sorting protein [Bacteroidota bacterium]
MIPETLILVLLTSLASAQTPSGDELLSRCESNFEGIEDYAVDLTAAINMERVRIPEMKAVLYFKRPDKINIKSDSFAMLPREGFALPVTALARNYDAILKGKEEIEGKQWYRLQLTAKKAATRVQSLTVWVDPENYTLTQTSSAPYRGRSVTVRTWYARHQDRYWLPERMLVTFTSTAPDTSSADEFSIPGKPQLEEFRRPPRNGTMEVRYANYRVNSGLSEDLFKREME